MLVRKKWNRPNRWTRWRRVLVLVLGLVLTGACSAEDAARRVIVRTIPDYPDLAKKMHLSGKVKVEVVISPSGTVTAAKLAGGSPVFESSAIEAVKRWKFEPGPGATKMVVVLAFSRHTPD